MSTVFDDHSGDVERYDRDVIATGTTTVVENFYKAKSLWVEADPIGAPGVLSAPLDATETAWVFA